DSVGNIAMIGTASVPAPQDQVADALGMARGVRDGDRAALRVSHQRELLQTRGVDDLLKIVNPRFEGNVFNFPVGKPAPASVVAHQAEVVAEIANPVPPNRTIPFEVNVVETVGDFDDGVTVADCGVGKTNAVIGDAKPYFLAGGRAGWSLARHRSGRGDWTNEAVANARHGFDKGLIAQSLANHRDVAVEIVFFDRRLGPDHAH